MPALAVLGTYTIAAIALLTWSLTQEQTTAESSPAVFRVLESLIPGGVVILATVWLLLFGGIALISALDPQTPLLVPVSALTVLIATYAYIDWWTRAVALPTRGGMSPNEVALYFAGGLGAFGIAGGLLIFASVIRAVRGLSQRTTLRGTSSTSNQ